MTLEIRRLGPGDDELVAKVATREPRTALLDDPRALFLVALDGGEPVGLVLAYELSRRHGHAVTLCIYEVDVDAAWQRRGVASHLLATALDEPRWVGWTVQATVQPDNLPVRTLLRSRRFGIWELVDRDPSSWDFALRPLAA